MSQMFSPLIEQRRGQMFPQLSADDIARLGRSFNDMAGSLQRQIRRLEDLSRLQRRFTSDVSHELRTPLTTIRMASELLHSHRDEFPPALARSVELLNTELDRFESLLADLLEISRYDAGVARLESEHADIRGVIKQATADGGCNSCHTQGSCMTHCPVGLSPTGSIAGLKKRALLDLFRRD